MFWCKSAAWAASVACLAIGACVDINGGAVELSWSLRQQDGSGITCAEAQVARIQLCYTPEGGGGVADCSNEWPCTDVRGTTDFDVPPGRYALSIVPVCAQPGQTISAVVPPPIVRDVTLGDVVQMNALLVVGTSTMGGQVCQ